VDQGTATDSGDYHATLDHCLHDFGWAEKQKLQGRLIDGRYHGIAVGNFVEGGAGGQFENARMTIEADGCITVAVGATALGQGLATVMSQIAADALSLPLERIRLRHGSTTLVSNGVGSFHSRATVVGGSAVFAAADALLESLRGEAASRLRCAPGDVCIADGVVRCGDQRLELSGFAGHSVERQFVNHKLTYS
jgi:carbon-monoxide dehydrogenase large subunit